MEYVTLDGHTQHGEVWSPGPLYQTVWVLAPCGPVVVQVKKDKAFQQVEYDVPEPPGFPVSAKAVEHAYDVNHRQWRASIILGRDWYNRTYIAKERDYDVVPPTQGELDAAALVLKWHNHNQRAHTIFREGHNARVSISDKRFVELWKSDCDDDFRTSA